MAIKSDDPHAIEKLTDKLEKCEKKQSFMKQVNAYYRKNGTAKGFEDISDEQAAKIDETVRTGYSFEKQPFPAYELTNNNAEIRRLKKRIEEISKNKEIGFTGWQFAGGQAVANSTDNRLQLFFDEKPDDKQRAELKMNGFKWAPSVGAWQRQLNLNTIYAANRISFIAPRKWTTPDRITTEITKKE